MKTPSLYSLIAFGCGLTALWAADGVPMIDIYKNDLVHYGVSPEISKPRGPDVFYQARFFLKDRATLITLAAFVDGGVSELNKGTSSGAGESQVFFEGLRPTVTSICIEVRRFDGKKLAVTHLDMRGDEAKEMDRFLSFSDVFSLQPSSPWLVRAPSYGEIIVVQLAVEGRTVEFSRCTEESLPVKTVTERLLTVLTGAKSEPHKPTKAR